MKLYTYHKDHHNCYDSSVQILTLAQLDSVRSAVIEKAIAEHEGSEDFDINAEITELNRLLSDGDIDQAWEVFTEGYNGTEPQLKHPDDFYHVQEHELPLCVSDDLTAAEAEVARLLDVLRRISDGEFESSVPATERISALREIAREAMRGRLLYKVEHNFAYGWDDAGWTEDDKPMRFNSRVEAQAEIDDHIRLTKEAAAEGDMQSSEDASDYRIVPE